MTAFTDFVSPASATEPEAALVEAAFACLDRFTAAFNNCDTAGMDAELQFPHLMLSGASRLEWTQPGQHPPTLFADLKAAGWHHTRYESRQVALTAQDKVHVVLTYSRRNEADELISLHTNLWIVTRVAGRWGISLRSY